MSSQRPPQGPAVVFHGHFYQPPRANPWTGEIQAQPSAAPFRDWNARIHAECYHPNAFAHIPTERGDLLVNNFERMSFNVGPTLMTWLERQRPETYWRILDADRRSADRLGHGNAIAQAYHHTILPLSSERDVRTQVRWGLGDFHARFGRESEGIWLPETAASTSVLDILIEEGVAFTILAPWQAEAVRSGRDEWTDVSEQDVTRKPFRYMHSDGSGRSLALFFYDGGLAHSIAFDNAASAADELIDTFIARGGPGNIVHAATDGETYGHHWRFADLGLAYALYSTAPERGVTLTNYGAYLEAFPPTTEVKVWPEGSSWSCSHGVERWRADCGCTTLSKPGWDQGWRAPLRRALEIVREGADDAFEEHGDKVFADPWRARYAYVDLLSGHRTFEEFLAVEGTGDADPAVAIDLLRMQESAMSMFTSCAWFFADISGIETQQIMAYAERTLRFLEAFDAPGPRTAYLEALAEARSNVTGEGNGADVHRSMVARVGLA